MSSAPESPAVAPTKATKYLKFDASGAVTGVGFTPDGTVPPTGAIACTAAQAKAWAGSTVVNGAVVPPPPPSAPEAAQAAYVAAVAAGVAITSTRTPALTATYALDQISLSSVTVELAHIATAGKFSNGRAERAWIDRSGKPHVFPSIAEFTAVFEAVMQYDDALFTALDAGLAGGAWVAPAAPAPIA